MFWVECTYSVLNAEVLYQSKYLAVCLVC